MVATQTNVDWEVYAAELYDNLQLLRPYQAYIADICAAANAADTDIVLDAGCGTGNILVALQKKCRAQLYGVDLSEAMISRCRSKCDTGVSAHISSVDQLQFANGFFSMVTCGNMLYTVPDAHAVLCELARVMQPNAQLVLSTPKHGFEGGLILKEHCQDTGPDEPWLNIYQSPEREAAMIERAFTKERHKRVFQEIAVHNRQIQGSTQTTFYTECALSALLEESGFVDVSISLTYANQLLLATAKRATQ